MKQELQIAAEVGTPFYLYDEATLCGQIEHVRWLTEGPGLQARFAVKANPATRVLQLMAASGLWADAVSGNEALRARRAGFPAGNDPPYILLTSDVWRDNALQTALAEQVLPNLGSPGMWQTLAAAGYTGPLALRINPGFGHGHVNTCDTGGPSAKHGIWPADLPALAAALAPQVAMLHAHVGSGPQPAQFLDNMRRLITFFADWLPLFPAVQAVSLGGGLPFDYAHTAPLQQERRPPWLAELRQLLLEGQAFLAQTAGRPLRLEIEPGRYLTAPAGILAARVLDVKQTGSDGVTFAMVDAGFNDLLRPALYGAVHAMRVVRADGAKVRPDEPVEAVAVAGPLCESGDVFTRTQDGRLTPRLLPRPRPGDLLIIEDVGAYGYAMSSNYNSLGQPPQLWRTPDGAIQLISRRATLADLLRLEVPP